MKKKKTVYVSMIADLLHAGHIKILEAAFEKGGKVTLDWITTSAINELGDTAYLKYDQRKKVLENLSFVNSVIPQESASYKKFKNL